jgi:cyclopropane-fatty-acyl-phospholipid synthase
VDLKNPQKAKFKEQKINIKKIEEKLNFEISKNQNIIEYSPNTFKYLKTICDIIQRNDGGILIIDYGYLNSKMCETLQAVNNHKYSNILENIGDSDITYNINFNLFQKFTKALYDQLIQYQKVIGGEMISDIGYTLAPQHGLGKHSGVLGRFTMQTAIVNC